MNMKGEHVHIFSVSGSVTFKQSVHISINSWLGLVVSNFVGSKEVFEKVACDAVQEGVWCNLDNVASLGSIWEVDFAVREAWTSIATSMTTVEGRELVWAMWDEYQICEWICQQVTAGDISRRRSRERSVFMLQLLQLKLLRHGTLNLAVSLLLYNLN